MKSIAFVLICVSTLWTVLGLFALLRTTRRKRDSHVRPSLLTPGPSPSLTVLKPLCGADAGLADNLSSFFEQDHENFELIFGVQIPNPSIPIVHSLRRRYPTVRAKLVVHDTRSGINPKVRNLMGMIGYASHDLVLISDSNVFAPKGYLREAVTTLCKEPTTGLVTHLFVGRGENTLGSAMENVQLNGFCAAGTTLPTLLGDALVVGKSMLFSGRVFAKLGGFERVANVLAEDFVIGKTFQHAGYRIVIAPTVLCNVTSCITLRQFFARHLRWSMLRWRLRPLAFALEPVASPLVVLPLAILLFGGAGVLWALGMWLLRDLGGWITLRGFRRAWVPLLLSPFRDLAALLVWFVAPFKHHVRWRGRRVRVGAGTLLFGEGAPVSLHRV